MTYSTEKIISCHAKRWDNKADRARWVELAPVAVPELVAEVARLNAEIEDRDVRIAELQGRIDTANDPSFRYDMESVILARLTDREYALFQQESIPYSCSTGAGANPKDYGGLAPYVATFAGSALRAISAFGWEKTEVLFANGQVVCSKASDDAEIDRLRKSVLNQAGDNHCWLNGDEAKIPPFVEFIQSCVRHHAKVAGENGVLEGCMTIAQLEAEVEQLRSRLAVHETGVPEVMQGAMNEIRKQAAQECAAIAETYCSNSGRAITAAIREKFGVNQ